MGCRPGVAPLSLPTHARTFRPRHPHPCCISLAPPHLEVVLQRVAHLAVWRGRACVRGRGSNQAGCKQARPKQAFLGSPPQTCHPHQQGARADVLQHQALRIRQAGATPRQHLGSDACGATQVGGKARGHDRQAVERQPGMHWLCTPAMAPRARCACCNEQAGPSSRPRPRPVGACEPLAGGTVPLPLPLLCPSTTGEACPLHPSPTRILGVVVQHRAPGQHQLVKQAAPAGVHQRDARQLKPAGRDDLRIGGGPGGGEPAACKCHTRASSLAV